MKFVAYSSIVRPDAGNPVGVVPDHRATEQKLRDSGLQWSFLRNSVYADFESSNAAAALATGKLVTNGGAGQVAYVAREDCAAAAAAVVTGGDHAGKAYDITGPELLDAEGRAAIIAELGHRPVEVVHVDDDTFAAGVADAAGLPLEVGRLLASFGAGARDGWLDVISSDVQELTGRAPAKLRSVLAEQRVSRPSERVSPGPRGCLDQRRELSRRFDRDSWPA